MIVSSKPFQQTHFRVNNASMVIGISLPISSAMQIFSTADFFIGILFSVPGLHPKRHHQNVSIVAVQGASLLQVSLYHYYCVVPYYL